MGQKDTDRGTGKHLMLFFDRSGSMEGAPIKALVKGAKMIPDLIYPKVDNEI